MGKRREEQLNIRLVVIIPAAIVLLLIMTLILPKGTFSSEEGRDLNVMPSFDTGSFFDGTFEEDVDSYLSDHLAFREIWVDIRNYSLSALGGHDNNGVFKGKDSYLLEHFTDPGEERRKELTGAIASWAQGQPGSRVFAAIIPTSAEVMSAKLPLGASAGDQEAFLESVGEDLEGTDVHFINVIKTLKNHKEEDIYYRSDSNWTSLGAYYAYRNIGQEMELDMSADNFEAMKVSETFEGNLTRISGFNSRNEDINVYFPVDSNFQQVVEYDDAVKSASPYSSEALTSDYKMDVFWGGDHSFIKISTTSASKKTLLIIKDSYGNNFIPFMMVNYREILVVDPDEYYGNLNDLMKGQTVDDVLFLYSAQSLAEDKELITVLKGE